MVDRLGQQVVARLDPGLVADPVREALQRTGDHVGLVGPEFPGRERVGDRGRELGVQEASELNESAGFAAGEVGATRPPAGGVACPDLDRQVSAVRLDRRTQDCCGGSVPGHGQRVQQPGHVVVVEAGQRETVRLRERRAEPVEQPGHHR